MFLDLLSQLQTDHVPSAAVGDGLANIPGVVAVKDLIFR
jgi:hypothetical protein